MKNTNRILRTLCCGAALCAFFAGTALALDGAQGLGLRQNHPAIGAWFGKAVEDCVGPPETNCGGLGLPAVAIFMTPSFYEDGNFLGNDTLALASAPLGPHTTAHGTWVPINRSEFVADIVFMSNPFPPPLNPSAGAVHIKYSAKVISANEMVGYVNLYFAPPLELNWEALGPGQFPTLPAGALDLVKPPEKVYTTQSACITAGCPLVFRFRIQRVTP